MKNIIKFSVSNPVSIFMVVLAILLLGKISYDQLSVDLLPDLNNPRLYIELKAGERPPEEIEKQFIKSIESMAIRQSDVTQVSSVIRAGSARITVEYTWEKDMDEAFLDLQKAINPFLQNPDINELKITQHDPNQSPVILIGISHKKITDMAELRKVTESYIRNELVRLEGVADITLSGDEVNTLTVRTNPYKLKAFGLNINDISAKIKANNQSISGGRVNEQGMQYLVKSSSMFASANDFENLIVGYKAIERGTNNKKGQTVTDNKAPIFLKEVATVDFENARPENIVRIDGKRSIGISVYKEMRYNTVKVVDAVTKQLKTIEQALPGYEFNIISNQGTFINNAIGEVKSSALIGILLAVIILYVFLRRIGTTLIVSLAIPISIIATFNLMFFNHLTLNIMTLGGLALGAGMLVDNAIVVIESIFRNQEKGLSVKEAAIKGTSEVGAAVIASTLTTIVVFLPIVYLHGASGELFKDQAWTVTFSLVSSLFVAILVIPMLYDKMNGKKKQNNTDYIIKSIQFTGYSKMLRKLLKHYKVVIGLAILTLGITAAIFPFIGTEFIPKTESNTISIVAKLPEGTKLERTNSTVENLENIIHSIAGEDSLCTIYSHIGPGSSSNNNIFDGENTAKLKILLAKENKISSQEIISQLINYTENMEGLEITVDEEESSFSSLLNTEGAPIVVEIKGEELEELSSLTEEVKEIMTTIPGLYNIKSSIEDGAPEISISINRTIAGINNISVNTIIDQMKQQLSGLETGKMDYQGDMLDIIVKVPEISTQELNNLIIKNGEQEFRLEEIADISYTKAPKEILRRGQNRISQVLANMDNSHSLDKVADEIRIATEEVQLPLDYTITVTGEEEKRQESINSLMFALMLSIILVYMVLASQFESLLHPFTILLTIPLAVAGAILLFFITGTTISMMGVIGIVMLVGIAVNNSIILVDRINQLKQKTPTLEDAIVEASGQRIRPILMTTLTTILSLLPMAINFGEGASLRAPMAIAVIGGLMASTVMSLMVIPCVYWTFENLKKSIRRK